MDNSYPNAQYVAYNAPEPHIVDYSYPPDDRGNSGGPFGDTSSQLKQDLYSTAEPVMGENITVNNRRSYPRPMNGRHYSFQNEILGQEAVPSFRNRDHGSGWYATWPPLTGQTLAHRGRPVVAHATPTAPGPSSQNHRSHGGPNSPYETSDSDDLTTRPQRPVHSIQPNVTIPGLSHPNILGVVLWMKVPPELCGSEQDIVTYVQKFRKQLDWFKKELDAEVTHVVCSLCLREHSCKPSNLVRHLRSHLDVKTYACRVCTERPGFTTKDQAVVHAQHHHGVTRGSAELETVIIELK
ncbi:hypothetical protein B0J17DRAFT_628878 [Rhizoctonia solani]|nr:hypothetical protein B0J17DRAFT_628878 [Rhizoctonia solani]